MQSRITKGIESKSLSTLSYGLTSTTDAFFRRPDVALVMNCANGYWLPLLKARGIPTLVNVDGIEWERGKWGRAAKAVFKTGAKLTARFADRLVFDAHEIGRRWREDFNRDGAFIPYGGDTFGPLALEPDLEDGKYVLVVARFVAENTIVEFIDAARRLSATADVVIVGSSGYGGEIEERVAQLAREHERVRWLGHVSDDSRLASLWQHAGAYFHGHSVGGTNPALVQAMALGAPVVARDTPYNREVLGGAGLLVEPSGAAIADAASRLLRDSALRQQLGAAASDRAASAYTWEGVCGSYELELAELVKAHRPGRLSDREAPGPNGNRGESALEPQ